ncbi:MAG: hypothetical protein HYV16_11565 [Gammaproteobacteria bacterium]|nr:hypothetical protein [Gammaproteobacteria bacterium]
MHRNVVALLALASLTACSKHDLPYYQDNLDAAASKVEECETAMKAAFMAKDEDNIKAVLQDPECRAADKAHKDHKNALAAQKAKLQEEELRRKKAEDEKAYAAQYAEHKQSLESMPITDFHRIQQECLKNWSAPITAQCKAAKELKESRHAAEVSVLLEKYKEDALTSFADKQCHGMDYNELYCELSHSAINKQREDQIAYYLSNRDGLKMVFNQCHEKYLTLRKSQKWKEAREAVETFPCRMVSKAAQKLRIFGFNQPIG